MRLVTGDDITAAEKRLDGRVVRTPLLAAPALSAELGLRISVKAENLQHTGSFKARGAMNALLARAEREGMPAGLVAFSAGNHAIAVAFVGRAFALPTVVCMPPGAVPTKLDAVRRLGAEVVLTHDLLDTAQGLAAERGYHLLPPFDDPDVIAGQATIGRELLADGPAPALVLVPVGGGGLISGIAAAVKEASPTTRIVGVEPDGANAMSYALRTGTPTPPVRPASVADGLAAPFAGRHTLAHVRALVDDLVEVPEESILPAWSDLLDATKLLIEPAAAVTLAALRAGLVEVAPGDRTVLVLSGGNVAPSRLATLG
ncbi:threonine dehydratase [Micromonospora kangleipakensis]|uniref:Threonine dehydratase n=1 Tax=Micromonospora kangleipakensis TaxID=1077942 RepID=A0A4Q8BIA3_9ACTN|nr:threonine/serine dehydratase [Micromonospora kangleipakensis]RZU77261.1 threonine dehydratase [Micromonospora kangleipakensis]